MIDPDQHIRAAALAAIEKISRQWDGQVPWEAIRAGFQVGDERVLFANRARGIFKPQQMSAALSIKTTVPRTGRSRWYRDQDIDSLDHDTSLLRYDLARGGQNDPTNRALLAAMQRNAPLIYFIGLKPAIYQPIFPVWIKDFKQEEGYVLLATADFEIPEVGSANTVITRIKSRKQVRSKRRLICQRYERVIRYRIAPYRLFVCLFCLQSSQTRIQ